MRFSPSAALLLSLAPLSWAEKYGYNHVPVRKDSDIVVAGAFPDVNMKLLSPAFLTPDIRQDGFSKGTQGPSSPEVLEDFMQGLSDKKKYMTFKTANFTSEEGRQFPYMHLKNNGCKSKNKQCRKEKVRVWIQAAVHGNEPAGDEATQAILGKFASDEKWANSILDNVELVVLPRYSPDAVHYFQRTLASNFDPNRDHIKLARQQTRHIKKLFGEFAPHVVIDMHEYGAPSTFGGGKYVHGSDGLFSAAKNLNINKEIRSLSEELFAKNIATSMKASGFRSEPYVTGISKDDPEFVAEFAEAGTDAKIGRNAMGLTQAVVFLVEMRGIALADQEFQRRTAAGLTMMTSIVQTASDNAEKVFKTVEGGIKTFINSKEDVIISDYSESSIRPFTMVEKASGKAVQVPVKFASTTPALPKLTRARPEAYIIPAAWVDVAERLRVSGMEVETLSKPFKGSVEALTIISTKIDTSYYEGVIRVTATAEAKQRDIELPAGSFRVSTRQKNAALAFIALEPENIDSYVSFNIIPVEAEDEYPIFRVMA